MKETSTCAAAPPVKTRRYVLEHAGKPDLVVYQPSARAADRLARELGYSRIGKPAAEPLVERAHKDQDPVTGSRKRP